MYLTYNVALMAILSFLKSKILRSMLLECMDNTIFPKTALCYCRRNPTLTRKARSRFPSMPLLNRPAHSKTLIGDRSSSYGFFAV